MHCHNRDLLVTTEICITHASQVYVIVETTDCMCTDTAFLLTHSLSQPRSASYSRDLQHPRIAGVRDRGDH